MSVILFPLNNTTICLTVVTVCIFLNPKRLTFELRPVFPKDPFDLQNCVQYLKLTKTWNVTSRNSELLIWLKIVHLGSTDDMIHTQPATAPVPENRVNHKRQSIFFSFLCLDWMRVVNLGQSGYSHRLTTECKYVSVCVCACVCVCAWMDREGWKRTPFLYLL